MSPTRRDQQPGCQGQGGEPLRARSILEAESLAELLSDCLPSFGGGYLRRVWTLLDEAIGKGLPMTISVSGPVTASGQHHAWLNPLLDTGWFCMLSTTDAVCYHDGHRSLEGANEESLFEVPIDGDDTALREAEIIRITDIGFEEKLLLDQDAFIQDCLKAPEFQKRMSGTEMRSLLGARYAESESARGVREGLLALCHRKAIPVFVGAPSDGSVFLSSMKLWADAQLGGAPHSFDLDLHAEVFESCAYHYWGLKGTELGALGTLVLGGGVPKNFSLQPEPALSQVLGLEDITGYLYDIQITTAPVSDGSLSSCPPAEAVTWGKVDKDNHRSTCESMQADYSIVMPIIAKALLEKRAAYERWAERMGLDELIEKHPDAAGYLRDRDGYRLFERRDGLIEELKQRLRATSGLAKQPQHHPSTP